MSQTEELLEVNLFWSPSLKQEGFTGKAKSVSAENQVGKFDILPQHANFVSQIFDSVTIITIDDKEHYYNFKRGVLEVSNNLVKIFLGI